MRRINEIKKLNEYKELTVNEIKEQLIMFDNIYYYF
jgi:uncharacterized protein YnzC (UPF0291/DUF896 family)